MPKEVKAVKNLKKEIQKKYMQLQIFQQQMSAYAEEKGAIDEKIVETTITISAIKELGTVQLKNEMWSSLGTGTFVRSDIKDKEQVLLSVGAGIVIKVSRERAEEVLRKRIDQLGELDRSLMQEINRLGTEAEKIEHELQSLIEQSEKNE
ncbi:MAG: prefoldin subunit alpha [Candidatus Aenigmatarchaeota archaeon]